MQGMQPHQRMQRTTVMARREVRGTGHGQGRSGKHGANLDSRTQLRQRLVNDFTRSGFLNKLYQRFDLISKLYTCRHDPTPSLVPGLNQKLEEPAMDHMFPARYDTCPPSSPFTLFEISSCMTLHTGALLDKPIFHETMRCPVAGHMAGA